MKQYPSISRSTGQNFREFEAYVFDKLDGSNLRAEWSRKKGWNKFGTRNRLFDQSDPDFGEAIELFMKTLASDIDLVTKDQRWDQVTIFMEFWGFQSFAGQHVKGDPKFLTLFDVNPYKKGLLGPKEFLNLFGRMSCRGGVPHRIPNYLGRMNWTRGFVERVRNDEVGAITFEGVVGKAGEGHDLIMAKAKTQAWIDKVKAQYGEENGEKIINS